MFDKINKENYGNNILGVRVVLPKILKIFEENEIYATWATVGFLFSENRDDLLDNIPACFPNYRKQELSSYQHIKDIGQNEIDDPYHYGASLIRLIKETSFQEIGSHTFSHYYCLEDGQTKDDFIEDLKAFNRVSKETGISSIVFPRNQVNEDYLESCALYGIRAYRGTEKTTIYMAESEKEKTRLSYRALRLADSYINIYGHNTYKKEDIELKNGIINLPASRFLRPYFNKLKILESKKLKRILNDMTYAAKNQEIYHLWWHPHNSGSNIDENLKQIKLIVQHYRYLHTKYNWKSTNMKNLAGTIINEKQEPANLKEQII